MSQWIKALTRLNEGKHTLSVPPHDTDDDMVISNHIQILERQNEIYRKALERINNFYTPIESVKEMATEALQDAQKLAGGK